MQLSLRLKYNLRTVGYGISILVLLYIHIYIYIYIYIYTFIYIIHSSRVGALSSSRTSRIESSDPQKGITVFSYYYLLLLRYYY